MNQYTVYVTPAAWREIKNLPGNYRQRIQRAVDKLADNPRPAKSKVLDIADIPWEVRRLRLDRWRVIIAITEEEKVVDVLAVRKRPPYDYGDLDKLLKNLSTK